MALDDMSPFNASLPSETRSAWRSAFKSAALFEGVVATVFLVLLVVPSAMGSGADNPLWFYLAGLFHLPTSLLFPVLYDFASQLLPHSSTASLLVAGVVVAVAQFCLVAVLLRVVSHLSSNTSLERTRDR